MINVSGKPAGLVAIANAGGIRASFPSSGNVTFADARSVSFEPTPRIVVTLLQSIEIIDVRSGQAQVVQLHG